jgi:hypothetical protein
MMNLMYFEYSEFDSKDLKGSGYQMDTRCLFALEEARDWVELNWNRRGKSRIVFNIRSGYRTPSHNRRIGGVEDSSHTKGLAVDIGYKNLLEAFVIVISLAMHGFFRFGISFSGKFIHADIDDSKPVSVWGYPNKVMKVLGLNFFNKTEDI